MNEIGDMKNKRCGFLTVLEFDKIDKNHKRKYICKCDCGNIISVVVSVLKAGRITSCGCKRNEQTSERNRKSRKYNIIVKNKNIAEIYSEDGSRFIGKADWEDVLMIENFYWNIDSQGYVSTSIDGKYKSLHRTVMSTYKDEYEDISLYVDHINGDRQDSRKKNLRYVTPNQSSYNRKIRIDNSTGVVGVKKTRSNTYNASIMIEGRSLNLGNYRTIKDATLARKKAEEKYFGEFRRKNE